MSWWQCIYKCTTAWNVQNMKPVQFVDELVTMYLKVYNCLKCKKFETCATLQTFLLCTFPASVTAKLNSDALGFVTITSKICDSISCDILLEIVWYKMLLPLPFIKTQENVYKNVNENMLKMWMKTCFHSHFHANFHASVRLKKKRIVSQAIFLKTDVAGRLFILLFIQQKTDARTFFFSKFKQFFRILFKSGHKTW